MAITQDRVLSPSTKESRICPASFEAPLKTRPMELLFSVIRSNSFPESVWNEKVRSFLGSVLPEKSCLAVSRQDKGGLYRKPVS